MQPHLTKLLKTTKKHWAWIPRDTLDTAYQRFFAGQGGLPKFKRKHRYRSAKFQTGYKLEKGRMLISFKSWNVSTQSLKFKRRWFSFHQHRDWHGSVRYVQILRDSAGEYWLYIVTDGTSTEPMQQIGEKEFGANPVRLGNRTYRHGKDAKLTLMVLLSSNVCVKQCLTISYLAQLVFLNDRLTLT